MVMPGVKHHPSIILGRRLGQVNIAWRSRVDTTAWQPEDESRTRRAIASGGYSSLTTREQEILAKAMTCLKAPPSPVAFQSAYQVNSPDSEC